MDTEFTEYVKKSLNDLHTRLDVLEPKVEEQSTLTKDIAEIVKLGKGLFQFAYRLGSILRWIGGAFGGAMLVWHFMSDKIKSLFQ